MLFSQEEYHQLITLICPQPSDAQNAIHQTTNVSSPNMLPTFSGKINFYYHDNTIEFFQISHPTKLNLYILSRALGS